MVSFEKFVKSMPPSLSELKVTPSFCFAFKISDDVTASSIYQKDHYISFFERFVAGQPSILVSLNQA